jgi:hypothetical protein
LWRVCGDYIRRVLDCRLDLLDTLTVTLNYSAWTLQLTVHYNTCRVFSLCLHWLPVCQHRRTCSPTELTATASLTELTELPVLCSVTHLYSRGTCCAYCCVILVTRHVMFTVPLPRARASAILFAASHSTDAWLPSNCCNQTPYCLQHARHNIYIRCQGLSTGGNRKMCNNYAQSSGFFGIDRKINMSVKFTK